MDYASIIAYRNEHNYFAKFLGVTILDMKPGYARTELVVRPEHMNINGAIHGGCLFTLADITAGAASSSYGDKMATLDSSFHFLNPAINTTCLFAENRQIKKGKRVSVHQVSVTDQDGVLLAEGTFTYMTIQTKTE